MEPVGRYQVEQVVRVEPVGRTMRATSPLLNRRFYLQELCPPPSLPAPDRDRLIAGFERIAGLLSQCADPRIIRPCDAGATASGRYLAFEDPEAQGFYPLPREPRRVTPAVCAHVAAEACAALSSLVDLGIGAYWFDVDAVFVSPGGEVRVVPQLIGHLPVQMGLPRAFASPSPYAAPEVAAGGRGSQAALVFSIAAWVYATLTGGAAVGPLVVAGRQPDSLWRHDPSVPVSLDDAVQAALQADPERRLRTLGSFREALGAAPERRTAPERTLQPSPASSPELRQEPAPTIGAAPARSAAAVYAAWAAGLGVGGALLGWLAGVLLPPR